MRRRFRTHRSGDAVADWPRRSAGPSNPIVFLKTIERQGDFVRPGPLFLARAPGRLDVMGGIAQYGRLLVPLLREPEV